MNRGERVSIYYDPLTEEEFEDKAKLLRFKCSGETYNGRQIEYWEVRFTDGAKGVRKILAPAK